MKEKVIKILGNVVFNKRVNLKFAIGNAVYMVALFLVFIFTGKSIYRAVSCITVYLTSILIMNFSEGYRNCYEDEHKQEIEESILLKALCIFISICVALILSGITSGFTQKNDISVALWCNTIFNAVGIYITIINESIKEKKQETYISLIKKFILRLNLKEFFGIIIAVSLVIIAIYIYYGHWITVCKNFIIWITPYVIQFISFIIDFIK